MTMTLMATKLMRRCERRGRVLSTRRRNAPSPPRAPPQVKRSRLTNGGFWAAMFYAMSCEEAPGRGERRGSEAPLTPLQIFYEVR